MIRLAGIEDADGCYKLVKADDDSYWKLRDFRQSIEDDDAIFLVAEEGGIILGYIQGFILPTKRSEALVHETRVREEDRSRGIGTKLVDAFCKEAFIRGADVVLAEIDPDLLEFYRDSCGFSERAKWIEVIRRKG